MFARRMPEEMIFITIFNGIHYGIGKCINIKEVHQNAIFIISNLLAHWGCV